MIGPVFVVIEIPRQKIWEKQPFYNHKEYEKFHKNYDPQCLAYGHRTESVIVKLPDACQDMPQPTLALCRQTIGLVSHIHL